MERVEGRATRSPSFPPLLCRRKVLLHEDNQAVVDLLSHLTSRSPAMMDELRKLWVLIDTSDINIRALHSIRGQRPGRPTQPRSRQR
jgi:hypothetical protein